jgi:hypothetical protein
VDNIKMDLREIQWDGMDWIDLAQNRGQWRALLNTVMNLRSHKMLGSSWVAAQLTASQKGLSSMSEWVSECVHVYTYIYAIYMNLYVFRLKMGKQNIRNWIVIPRIHSHCAHLNKYKFYSEQFSSPTYQLQTCCFLWLNSILYIYSYYIVNTKSAQRLATGWTTEGSEFESRLRQEFSLLQVVQTDSGATQSFIWWVLGTLSPGVKRPGREADNLPPTIKKMLIYTSTPPYAFMAQYLIS